MRLEAEGAGGMDKVCRFFHSLPFGSIASIGAKPPNISPRKREEAREAKT
jgi:hypothetical protein